MRIKREDRDHDPESDQVDKDRDEYQQQGRRKELFLTRPFSLFRELFLRHRRISDAGLSVPFVVKYSKTRIATRETKT